jgi:hypothetical protein
LRRIAVCQLPVWIRFHSDVCMYNRPKQPTSSARQKVLELTISTMKSCCATVMPN